MRISDQHGNAITLGAGGIEITSKKDVTIKADGNVSIQGTRVDVK